MLSINFRELSLKTQIKQGFIIDFEKNWNKNSE